MRRIASSTAAICVLSRVLGTPSPIMMSLSSLILREKSSRRLRSLPVFFWRNEAERIARKGGKMNVEAICDLQPIDRPLGAAPFGNLLSITNCGTPFLIRKACSGPARGLDLSEISSNNDQFTPSPALLLPPIITTTFSNLILELLRRRKKVPQ